MADFGQLIEEFARGMADRCWIISQLEDVSDERVVSLFATTLGDVSQDEDVRIEILKSLVMRKDSTDARIRLGKTILGVLDSNDSDLVRQYAAKALRLYPEVDGVLNILEAIVGDDREDIDVRYNALEAIETNRAHPSYRESLQRLASVPTLGRSAQRRLESDAEKGRGSSSGNET